MNPKILKKGVILLAILVLPSILYLMLTTGRHNFVHLQYIGPRLGTEEVQIGKRTVIDTIYHAIPEFELIDEDGNLFSSTEYSDRIYVANFFFTSCPTICPAMQQSMLRLQDRFGSYDDFGLISFTVDPEHDTSEVLKAYGNEIGVNWDYWTFLTGETQDIYTLAMEGYFVNAMPDALAPGGFLHSEYLVLVDKDGHIRSGFDKNGNVRAVYDGTSDFEVNELIDDIKVLLAEYRLETKRAEKRRMEE